LPARIDTLLVLSFVFVSLTVSNKAGTNFFMKYSSFMFIKLTRSYILWILSRLRLILFVAKFIVCRRGMIVRLSLDFGCY